MGVSFCKTCIDFADQALDVLLNEILQIGVLGSCGEICALVQTKIHFFIRNIIKTLTNKNNKRLKTHVLPVSQEFVVKKYGTDF